MTTPANWFAVEWDPRGGVSFHHLGEVLRRNWKIATGKEAGTGKIVVGLCLTSESAQDEVRTLRAAIKERRVEHGGIQGQDGRDEELAAGAGEGVGGGAGSSGGRTGTDADNLDHVASEHGEQ